MKKKKTVEIFIIVSNKYKSNLKFSHVIPE